MLASFAERKKTEEKEKREKKLNKKKQVSFALTHVFVFQWLVARPCLCDGLTENFIFE